MKDVLNRKFLALALGISWLTAIIELLTSQKMVVYLPYGLIVPLLILLPRIVYKYNKNVRRKFNIELVNNIDYLVLGLVLVCAPGSLWWHEMGFQYDRLLHFATNVLNVPLAILVIAGLGIEKRKKAFILATILVFAGLFLFEGFQYSMDAVFGTQLFHDAVQNINKDVFEDIIFGVLGGLVGLYWAIYPMHLFKSLEKGGYYRRD